MTASLILVCDAIGSRHQFGPNGGAFGRSRKCDWVLPDPDRHLSSVHARILFQNDTFVLVDESTNGTFLEGQSAAIGRGKAVSLSPGMKLLAGPYQIRVDSLHAGQSTQTNPFARDTSRPAPAATPLRIDTSGASLPKHTSLDPLDHLGGGQPAALTPVASAQNPQSLIPEPVPFSAPTVPPSPHETTRFQGVAAPSGHMPAQSAPSRSSLMAPANPGQTQAVSPAMPNMQAPAPPQMPVAATPGPAPATPPSAPAAAASPESGNIIPEDFLAGLSGEPGGASAAATIPAGKSQGLPDLSTLMPSGPASSGPADGPAQVATIPDNVDFGISAPAPGPAAPPPPQTPAASPTAAMSSATPGDPALPAVPVAAPLQDTPLNPLDALKKRRAQREAELARKAKSRSEPPPPVKRPLPPVSPAKPAQSPPAGAAAPGSHPQAAPAAEIPPPAAQVTAAHPSASPPVTTPSMAASPPPSGSGADPEVFQALLAGLGFANADVPEEEQAQIARAAGEMVRELATGLIALLNARKSLKTEFRMYETRIQPEENNPFKHFNVGELAIDEMLFARKGGFLPPSEAARDAFKDLQGHTMLTVAATQRAMRILFESLSPETLAGEDDDGGLRLRSLGSRRGKFEAAKERHDRLRADFDAVVRQTIAEAFLQVEEDQARQQSKTFWENRKK